MNRIAEFATQDETKFGRDIVKRTVEGFGSITGASANIVPDKVPEQMPK